MSITTPSPFADYGNNRRPKTYAEAAAMEEKSYRMFKKQSLLPLKK